VYLVFALASQPLLGIPVPVIGAALLPVALIAAAAVRGRLDATRRLAMPGPVETAAAIAVLAMLLNDLVLFESPSLRDLTLYLRAGWFGNLGLPVYLASPMTYLPADPTHLPFLYPPFTLPFFGALARLPWTLVAPVWVGLSVLASLAALRLFGLSWRWSVAFLLWPPFAEGLYVGNVAVPALLLFAGAIRAGALLPLGAVFKLQFGIPSLWLVRDRRLREVVLGVALLAGLVAFTLPVVGVGRWREWADGLVAFRASELRFAGLSGQALSTLLPTAAYLLLALLAVVVALRARDREGLARMGIASIVASPSLYSHGFLVGLPAFLALNRFWFWIAMGFTASVWGSGWWVAVGIAAVAWRVPAMNHRAEPSELLHPLQGAVGPWRRPLAWAGVPIPGRADRKARSDA
jgi:hypothetical protein